MKNIKITYINTNRSKVLANLVATLSCPNSKMEDVEYSSLICFYKISDEVAKTLIEEIKFFEWVTEVKVEDVK